MQQALYRKYRPQSFKEVLGQDHITSVLESEAKSGKVSHAYLFAGSRGTGKTTLARIFARSLGVNSEDVYEMDAASNRGIDEVREIRDAVHAYPYSSKYKVYILDEAHMLTRDAWNALLKTLEEPPSHVIFILATTEAHKLPDTIISRCESFIFKKPTHRMLADNILKVAKEEKNELEKSSASLIATLAGGSFRDALSILQKAMSLSKDKKLNSEEIEKILGAPKQEFILSIIEALSEQNTSKALEVLKKASGENADMQVLLKMLVQKLRFVLLLRFAPKTSATKDSKNGDLRDMVAMETGEKEFERLVEIAKASKNINSKTLLAFLEAESLQKYADIPELPIEIAIIESCDVTPPLS